MKHNFPISSMKPSFPHPVSASLSVHRGGSAVNEDEQGPTVTSLPIGKKLDSRENVASEPHDPEDIPEEIRKYVSDRYRKNTSLRTVIQRLEGKHMLSLILYLDKMAPVIKTDVYNDVSRSSSMLTRISDLEAMGIIKIYTTGRTNNKVVTMTDKGKEVAMMIRKMIEIAEGQ